MKFLILTHAEAADEAVIRNVATYLMQSSDGISMMSGTTLAAKQAVIHPDDAPDRGIEMQPVIQQLTPTPPAQNFGFGAVVPPVAAVAPSTAAAATPAIVPVAPPVTSLPPAIAFVPPVQQAVSPAPVASPPAAAPPSPAATATKYEGVDKAGFPYDPRIHSGSGEKNKGDGTWRLKKGVDQALVAQVQAAFRAGAGINVITQPTPPTGAVAPPPTFVAPVVAAPPAAAVAPPPMVMPPAVALPQAAAVAPPAPTDAEKLDALLEQVFARLNGYVQQHLVDSATVRGICEAMGIANPTLLRERPDSIGTFVEYLDNAARTKAAQTQAQLAAAQ